MVCSTLLFFAPDNRTLKFIQGGTVDLVQVPGQGPNSLAYVSNDSERFEDGTLNFISIAAIPAGLALLSRYQPILPLRLSILTHWLFKELCRAEYAPGKPMVRVLSTPPVLLENVEQETHTGSTICFVMLDTRGHPISNDLVENAARSHIALVRHMVLQLCHLSNPPGSSVRVVTAIMAGLSLSCTTPDCSTTTPPE